MVEHYGWITFTAESQLDAKLSCLKHIEKGTFRTWLKVIGRNKAMFMDDKYSTT